MQLRKSARKYLLLSTALAVLATPTWFGVANAAQTQVANNKAATTTEVSVAALEAELKAAGGTVFPIGEPNVAHEKYFVGKTYVNNLSRDKNLPVFNVTFEPGAHSSWHVHEGSSQVVIAEAGRGYYQIWGQAPVELKPGDVVTIPAGVKHWHGAAPHESFQQLVLMEVNPDVRTDWLEPINEKVYQALP